MFNQQGQWICSKDTDIEMGYYKSYTESFQNAVNEVLLNEGLQAAQSYFQSAIKEEPVGQDWKRSYDCLVSLGVDIAELPQIIVHDDRDSATPPIKSPADSTPILIPGEQVQPTKEYVEPEPVGISYDGAVVAIIIAIAVLAFFILKIRSKAKSSRPIVYENSDKTKDEDHGNVEIEIKGGIDK
jgi:hypothetical protein